MRVSRRHLLQSAVAGAVGALPGVRNLAFAETGQGRDLVVVIFLRGGCDALNMMAPANDRSYIDARPPELRVLDAGDRQGHRLDSNLVPGLDFRLHSEAAPLYELYRAGHLAIVVATGLSNATRSHFVAQDLIERGIVDEQKRPERDTGWLARYLAEAKAPASVPAVSANPGVSAGLLGDAAALAVPDLQGGLGIPGGEPVRQALARLYGSGEDVVARAGRQALQNIAAVDVALPRGPDGKVAAYQPDNGAAYDGGGEFMRSLQSVARLAKAELGLAVAAVDCNGWDHHEGEPGRFNNLAGVFARNLAAFYNDMAKRNERMTIVVMSEFGRRLRANRSQGTDHGHGGHMLVLGGHVMGGRLYGTWPGLSTPELDRGVDLAVTTDYRAVLAELVLRRLGVKDTATILPGFTPLAPFGLFRT
ncbi:MAG: DUF1501 domain-containing protein [Proteobacteria bacterium]|nr:DUF1501 domain-containing protein [Pseudomonadota bacterium]